MVGTLHQPSCGCGRYTLAVPVAFDHILFVIVALGLPVFVAIYWYPRFMRVRLELLPRRRVQAYLHAILLEWSLVAALALLWGSTGRKWSELGLDAGHGLAAVAAWGTVPIVVAIGFFQRRPVNGRFDQQVKLLTQLGVVNRLMPQTSRELRLWEGVSLTAGMCEELLYRGFMIGYLAHWMPIFGAALGSSILFGLGHAYQGTKGALKISALGLVFAVVYILSGTIWPLVLAHAIMDVHAGRTAFGRVNSEF